MATTEKFFELLSHSFNLPMSVLKLTPLWWKMAEQQRVLGNIVKRNVENAVAQDKIDNSLAGTVLDKLYARCGKDSQVPFSMAMDSLQAGLDTTGNQGVFLLYHLATNPDKQDRLFKEICEVLGPSGNMNEEKLVRMRYLKACLNESQRLLPVVDGTMRVTQVCMNQVQMTRRCGTRLKV